MLRKSKNSIVFLFLAVMFLFKFVSVQSHLHASFHETKEGRESLFAHDEESHEEQDLCQICVDIFEAALTPFNYQAAPIVECLVTLLPKGENQKNQQAFFTKDFFASDLSNRPPPFTS